MIKVIINNQGDAFVRLDQMDDAMLFNELDRRFRERGKITFSYLQQDKICYEIGEWYFVWKVSIVDFESGTHKLGYAKEKLKEMICGISEDEQN